MSIIYVHNSLSNCIFNSILVCLSLDSRLISDGKLRHFAVFLSAMGQFSEKVFSIVRQVPVGKVTTYGQVARIMGRPQSARYVGFALRNNPSPGSGVDNVPCHRVLFRDGSLCESFAFGGPDIQREMLQAEGITFVDNTHVDLSVYLWDGNITKPDFD